MKEEGEKLKNPKKCPTCGSNNTEKVDYDFNGGKVIVTRFCNNCDDEDRFYHIEYSNPTLIQKGTVTYKDAIEEYYGS